MPKPKTKWQVDVPTEAPVPESTPDLREEALALNDATTAKPLSFPNSKYLYRFIMGTEKHLRNTIGEWSPNLVLAVKMVEERQDSNPWEFYDHYNVRALLRPPDQLEYDRLERLYNRGIDRDEEDNEAGVSDPNDDN